MKFTHLVGSLLMLLSLLLALSSSAAAQVNPSLYTADPARYVLTIEDLPAGFRVIDEQTGPLPDEHWLSGQLVPLNAPANPEATGRLRGYAALYERSGPSALIGTAAVASAAVVFASDESASRAFAAAHRDALLESWEPITIAPLGDEWRAYSRRETTTWDREAFDWRTFRLHVRTRNVDLCLMTTAINDSADLDEALAFARLMLSRIHSFV